MFWGTMEGITMAKWRDKTTDVDNDTLDDIKRGILEQYNSKNVSKSGYVKCCQTSRLVEWGN